MPSLHGVQRALAAEVLDAAGADQLGVFVERAAENGETRQGGLSGLCSSTATSPPGRATRLSSAKKRDRSAAATW